MPVHPLGFLSAFLGDFLAWILFSLLIIYLVKACQVVLGICCIQALCSRLLYQLAIAM